MKARRNTDRTDKKMYILTVISVLIAALTFLFGSGVISQYYLSDSLSSPAEDTVASEQDIDASDATGTSAIIGDQTDILGEIREVNSSDIYIENVILADDGFYYEYPGTNQFTNMEKLVLIGTFTYAKDLDEEERKEWRYSGELLNSDGEICYGDRTGFWSDYETLQFAIDLPEEIKAGKYTCIIYHYVGGRQYSATIQFEIH